jgi:uncharacterized membrane protein
MAMSTRRSWNAIIVISFALLMGSLYSAGWAFQTPQRRMTEEDRKRLLENLTRQAQPRRQSSRQSQEQSAPVPVPPQSASPSQPAPSQPAPSQSAPPASPAATPPAPPASGSGQRMVLN